MIKVIDKIIEPSKVFVGSSFLFKIKIFKGLTYNELKNKTYNEAMKYTYNQLKGE